MKQSSKFNNIGSFCTFIELIQLKSDSNTPHFILFKIYKEVRTNFSFSVNCGTQNLYHKRFYDCYVYFMARSNTFGDHNKTQLPCTRTCLGCY